MAAHGRSRRESLRCDSSLGRVLLSGVVLFRLPASYGLDNVKGGRAIFRTNGSRAKNGARSSVAVLSVRPNRDSPWDSETSELFSLPCGTKRTKLLAVACDSSSDDLYPVVSQSTHRVSISSRHVQWCSASPCTSATSPFSSAEPCACAPGAPPLSRWVCCGRRLCRWMSSLCGSIRKLASFTAKGGICRSSGPRP